MKYVFVFTAMLLLTGGAITADSQDLTTSPSAAQELRNILSSSRVSAGASKAASSNTALGEHAAVMTTLNNRLIPLVLAGKGIQTEVMLVSMDSVRQDISVYFLDDDGLPLEMPIEGVGRVAKLTATIWASGTYQFKTDGPDDTQIVGYAVIFNVLPSQTTLRLGGHYGYRSPSMRGFFQPTNLADLAEARFVVPFNAEERNQFFLHFINLEPDKEEVRVNCTVRDNAGVDTYRFYFRPKKYQRFIPDFSKREALTGTAGTIECTSEGSMGAGFIQQRYPMEEYWLTRFTPASSLASWKLYQ